MSKIICKLANSEHYTIKQSCSLGVNKYVNINSEKVKVVWKTNTYGKETSFSFKDKKIMIIIEEINMKNTYKVYFDDERVEAESCEKAAFDRTLIPFIIVNLLIPITAFEGVIPFLIGAFGISRVIKASNKNSVRKAKIFSAAFVTVEALLMYLAYFLIANYVSDILVNKLM